MILPAPLSRYHVVIIERKDSQARGPGSRDDTLMVANTSVLWRAGLVRSSCHRPNGRASGVLSSYYHWTGQQKQYPALAFGVLTVLRVLAG